MKSSFGVLLTASHKLQQNVFHCHRRGRAQLCSSLAKLFTYWQATMCFTTGLSWLSKLSLWTQKSVSLWQQLMLQHDSGINTATLNHALTLSAAPLETTWMGELNEPRETWTEILGEKRKIYSAGYSIRNGNSVLMPLFLWLSLLHIEIDLTLNTCNASMKAQLS